MGFLYWNVLYYLVFQVPVNSAFSTHNSLHIVRIEFVVGIAVFVIVNNHKRNQNASIVWVNVQI